MLTDTQQGAIPRLTSRLTSMLALGWMAAITFVCLFQYDGLVWLLQFARLAAATVPTLRIGPHFGTLWLGWLADAGVFAAILAVGLGAGALPVARLIGRRDLFGALLALGIGLWIVAVSVLAVASFSVRAVPVVFLLGACWCLPEVRAFFRWQPGATDRLDGWSKVLLGVIGVAAVLSLLGALAPPFEYDELEYHLGALGEYIRAGRIVFLPHNFYSNLPQLTEMLYLLGIVTHSDIAAKLLHWGFGLLTAGGMYALGTELWSRRAGLTAAALFYCLPFVQDLSQTARIDLATTFFALLAFGCLLREDSYLAAVAAGCAVATKWTAVPVVLLPALVFLAAKTRSFRLPALFALLSSLFILPWLVKNWLLTGNPVYPLWSDYFPNQYWNARQVALFAEKHFPSFDAEGLRQLPGLLWKYSFAEPGALPLLLATAPLILLFRNVDRTARRAGWLFVAAYAGWYLLTFRPWRFLFPALPLAALVGAYALERWRELWRRAAVALLLLAGLGVCGIRTLLDEEDYQRVPPRLNLIQYALGTVSRQEFASRLGGGVFESIFWMNDHLPASAKVLYMGEARPYFARQPVVWGTAYDQHPLARLVAGCETGEQLLAAMQRAGITHVYVNFDELQRLGEGYGYLRNVPWGPVRKLLQQHARSIHTFKRMTVYELER